MTNATNAEPIDLNHVRALTAERAAVDMQTDGANAELLARLHGEEIRFAVPSVGWLVWDGARWRRDDDGEITRRARSTARRLAELALEIENYQDRGRALNHAHRSDGAPGIRAMIELARSERSLIVRADGLDSDPMLLNCANGTVDLRTGELRKHDRADLITRITGIEYDPRASAPTFERFVAEVFGGDADLISFAQRLIGYCLTGDTSEHVLPVFHGTGCNGKTTLVNVVRRLLGEYAITAAFDTFTQQKHGGSPRNDLARLRAARFVSASESGRGHSLDEATLKEITGGDTVAARFLYREFFEFTPQFKLVLTTNYRPSVDPTDDAIWRRLRLVPFGQSFEGKEDRDLATRLELELPGILAWAVEGCLHWQRTGLGNASAVQHATSGYRQDEDVLGAFLKECCRTGDRVLVSDFRQAYDSWCERNGERPLAAGQLAAELGQKGFARGRVGGGRRTYEGLELVTGDTR